MAWLIFGTYFLVSENAPMWVRVCFIIACVLEMLHDWGKHDIDQQMIRFYAGRIARKLGAVE